MPRYLIHIGPHKTGTTYLQAAFQALRPKLLERGVWYPEHWQGEDKLSHHRLAQRLRGNIDTALASEFSYLNESSYDTILISAEDVADLRAEGIAYLKMLLGKASAHVIFYCRRWSELLPSGWQELIKHGTTTTFPEFFSAHVVNSFGSHLMNYGQTLTRYAEHFGLPNISLVSYSNIVDGDDDLFVNFCRNFLSWNDPPALAHGRVNVSLDPVEVEIIRALNAIERSRGGEQSDVMLRCYRQNEGDLELSGLIPAMRSYIGHVRMNEGLGPLQYLHEELFRQFGSLLVEPHAGRRLFAPKVSDIPFVRQDYLLSVVQTSAMLEVYRKIRGETN